jgi:hypothetical protein
MFTIVVSMRVPSSLFFSGWRLCCNPIDNGEITFPRYRVVHNLVDYWTLIRYHASFLLIASTALHRTSKRKFVCCFSGWAFLRSILLRNFRLLRDCRIDRLGFRLLSGRQTSRSLRGKRVVGSHNLCLVLIGLFGGGWFYLWRCCISRCLFFLIRRRRRFWFRIWF